MLKISPAVTVNNVPTRLKNSTNNYILYPDSEDRNLYYAMAEQPTFLADAEGNPNFNLTWYFGSGVEEGGICTMTVALPMPDVQNAEVRAMLLDAIKGDQTTTATAHKIEALCHAMDAQDAAQIAALKSELGFNDEVANKRKATWDKSRDWTQFLPENEKLDIRPMPYATGKVVVQAFADPEAYRKQKPEYTGTFETTPSNFNDNAAVVTLDLGSQGVNLFWHGMGGYPLDPNSRKPDGNDRERALRSFIAVTYHVTFDGLLPEATATVTLTRETVATLNIEQLVRQGAWGSTYRQDVVRGKEFKEAATRAVTVTVPNAASKDEENKVRDLLTDWAGKQLEEMTKAQFPEINLDALDINAARTLSNVQTQSRTYKLQQAVTLPKHPQGQLPTIDTIVDGDASKRFFRLIDLNDVPYFKMDLTVRPPSYAYLKGRQVERFVVTQLEFSGQKLLDKQGQEVGSLEFVTSEQQPIGSTYRGTFGKQVQDAPLQYAYLVSYGDGTPPFQVPLSRAPNHNYLDLGGVDLGVLSVSLNPIDLPWDVLSSVKVELHYGDWSKVVQLQRGTEPTLVTKPFGQPIDQSLSYRVTLNLTVGDPVVGELTEVKLVRGHADITLLSPLSQLVKPITFILRDGVDKAQLRVEYLFRGRTQRTFSQVIQLDRAINSGGAAWNVPWQGEGSAALKVVRARITTATGVRDLTDMSGGSADPLGYADQVEVGVDGLSIF